MNEWEGRWWEWVDKKKAPSVKRIFRENGKAKCSPKTTQAKTNKRVSQQRENILKLTDGSSPRICRYSSCQGPLQRLGHRLAAALACDRAPRHWATSGSSSIREGRIYLSVKVRAYLLLLLLCFLHHFSVMGWRRRLCQSLSLEIEALFTTLALSTLILYPVFDPCQNMSNEGLVRKKTDNDMGDGLRVLVFTWIKEKFWENFRKIVKFLDLMYWFFAFFSAGFLVHYPTCYFLKLFGFIFNIPLVEPIESVYKGEAELGRWLDQHSVLTFEHTDQICYC